MPAVGERKHLTWTLDEEKTTEVSYFILMFMFSFRAFYSVDFIRMNYKNTCCKDSENINASYFENPREYLIFFRSVCVCILHMYIYYIYSYFFDPKQTSNSNKCRKILFYENNYIIGLLSIINMRTFFSRHAISDFYSHIKLKTNNTFVSFKTLAY